MNTRFHVPTRVFGSRRNRGARNAGESESQPAPATLSGNDPLLIDPSLNDRPGLSCSYLIRGDRTALIDPGSARAAPRVLEALTQERIGVDLILLTHLHPGVAAGAGIIARHFPGAKVVVPAGTADQVEGYGDRRSDPAGLLADPATLLSSMEKVYGERAESIFGRPLPIDSSRISAARDAERIDLGDREIEVIATPGHTAFHQSFFDPATSSLFCGDALGVQLPGSRAIRPSTPPWDFSLDDAIASIGKLAETGAGTVYLAHYGAARPGPGEIFPLAAEALQRWHRSFLKKRAQTESDEELSRQFNACVEASLEPIAPSARRDLETVSPAWLNLAGLSAEQDRRRSLPDAA